MDQLSWLERLTGGTRSKILALLLRGERTVQEVAGEIGVSANAIRGHIASMQRDGLVVQSATRRETGGKPAATYAVSPEADELFPKAYALVLERVIRAVEEELGPEGLEDVLARVGRDGIEVASGTPSERVAAAAELLGSLGAVVEVVGVPGGFRIEGFACPLSAVAREDARICGVTASVVSAATGAEVRECCDRDGSRPRCAFEVSFGGP